MANKKSLKKRIKRMFKGKNLVKIVIVICTIATIATTILPYII